MSDSDLQVVAEQNNLGHAKVQELLSRFGGSFKEANAVANAASSLVVIDEAQTDRMKQARDARLKLKAIRVDVEHTRKELKEESLREGKAIDGMANIIKALIVPVEEHLERQEKFAELKRAERMAARLSERTEKLAPFVEMTSAYNLNDMDDATFDRLLEQAQTDKDARDKAAAEVEAARIAAEKAAAEEQERIKAENDRLKAEAAKRDAELAAERRKREAAEADARAMEDAEKAAQAKAAEEQRQAVLAPDREKLSALADSIEAIALPEVQDNAAAALVAETGDFISRIAKNLRQKAGQL